MRELDVLLTRYLETGYPQATDHQKAAFHRLLALSDPELSGYLLGGMKPVDPEIASVVGRIRGGNCG